ncbi:TPA: hypothetical protein SMI12_001246 [Serratia liquefaciens]|nr:hypothetical protein [Serratia liquefaciens]
MAYDPQQQRPEEQALNNNRESLNIRQPGETGSTGFDWEQVRKAREAAGRKSVVPDPSIGLGDALRAAGSGVLDGVSGTAQFVKGLVGKADDYANSQDTLDRQKDLGLSEQSMETIRG